MYFQAACPQPVILNGREWVSGMSGRIIEFYCDAGFIRVPDVEVRREAPENKYRLLHNPWQISRYDLNEPFELAIWDYLNHNNTSISLPNYLQSPTIFVYHTTPFRPCSSLNGLEILSNKFSIVKFCIYCLVFLSLHPSAELIFQE